MNIANHTLLAAHPHKIPETVQKDAPPMMAVIARLTAKPGRANELKEVLAVACSLVRENEPDVVQYHVMQSRENDHIFSMFEVYRNEAALEYHINGTPYIARLMPMIMQPLACDPELEWMDSIFDAGPVPK